MVFSSVTFLFFFLPAVLIANFLTPVKFRNYLLILFSLIFYWWGEHRYVWIMVFSISMNYLVGIGIQRSFHNAVKKRWVTTGIVLNLSLLVFFKYADFIVANFSIIWEQAGGTHIPGPDIHLPIGISFFTFQALSYIIDVYREDESAMVRPDGIALYISSFPQLIAGPIVRYTQIKNQLVRRFTPPEKVSFGIKRFIIGLGKKILIANTLASAADGIFSIPVETLSVSVAWIGIVCYTLQIYFDFSGYSDMAIGLGHMLGFTFAENFNYPYISKSMREFWQRWHISLSTWFRDYLYIPLGGNQHGTLRTFRNLLIVFFLCGFWHGASWSFVAWGLFHGFFLILERGRLLKRILPRFASLAHGYTLLVVMVGWVFFRIETLSGALAYLGAMIGLPAGSQVADPIQLYVTTETMVILFIAIVGATPVLPWIGKNAFFLYSDKNATGAPDLLWGAIQLQKNNAAGNYLHFVCR